MSPSPSGSARPDPPRLPPAETLTATLVSPLPFAVPRPVLRPLSKALGIDVLYALSGLAAGGEPQELAARTLAALGIKVRLDAAPVPREGPLVFVSNHPFGLLEGLVLLANAAVLRPDVRIMANSLLGSIEGLGDRFIAVDPFEGPGAQQRNVHGLREALRHLEEGGAVAVFPAGAVSHWQKGRGISDPDWRDTALRLSRRSGAAVAPLYFQGRNSLSFSLAGLVHPALRTLLLPRELLKKRNSAVSLRGGEPIGREALEVLPTLSAQNEYLRLRCYSLGEREAARRTEQRPEALAVPLPPALLEHAIAELPVSALVAREENYSLYLLRGDRSPCLVREMGRVREMTFREAGEGTGKARDVDRYDGHYWHLILWDDAAHEIAGGYRLGLVPEILRQYGPEGMYTSELFHIAPGFWERYGQSLELGRAVVRPERQRDFLPLLLLWKGIAAFVLRHPAIRYLFGPVSLNLDASPLTLRLIAAYLGGRHGDEDAARLVRARAPFAEEGSDPAGKDFLRAVRQGLLDYRGLDRLVRAQERGKGIPVLFKHYLKLGGRIAAFHEDKDFGSLDAFLLADLPRAPENALRRYMGAEGARDYAARHAPLDAPRPIVGPVASPVASPVVG